MGSVELFFSALITGAIFVVLLRPCTNEYDDKSWIALGCLVVINLLLGLSCIASTYFWIDSWFPEIEFWWISLSSSNVSIVITAIFGLTAILSIALGARTGSKEEKLARLEKEFSRYVTGPSAYLFISMLVWGIGVPVGMFLFEKIFSPDVGVTVREAILSVYESIGTLLFFGTFGYGILGVLTYVLSIYLVDKTHPDSQEVN